MKHADTNGRPAGELARALLGWTALAIALTVVAGGVAGAVEIPTGTKKLTIRWDNTIKYNLGYRLEDQDPAILKAPNNDDGDRNFADGVVSNRLDLLSELDIQLGNDFGLRVSGAGWYDQRYHDALDNTSVATSNHLENGLPALGLSSETERLFAGPNGELLDAFVFGKVNLGAVPLRFKIGRHTVYWGESLMFSGALHSVSYGQMPIDTLKAFAVPGTDAKELFRPLFNVSAQAQLTSTLSVAAQQFFEWEPYRLPEAGSYLGFSDILLKGGESLIAGPARYRHGEDVEPSGKHDWGLEARWSPRWLDGTLGAYYRRFTDKLPQSQLNPVTRQYFFVYPDGIDLYGLSLSKQILGASIGAELSYRKNMPLISDAVVSTVIPAEGETFGARGNTWHSVLNAIAITRPPLCDLAAVSMELTWNRWDKVTQGGQYFKGRDTYTAIDRVSKDFVGVGVGFTPTFYQVLPGADLSLPLAYSRGVSGNSAVTFGGNENGGNFSLGLSVDYHNRYRFDLKAVGFFGNYATGPTGGISVANGAMAQLGDRRMLTFTFKVTY
jgi:hypothetical protein